MLNNVQMVNEIFTMLKERSDAAGVTDYSHWTRATMLQRLNIAQDELTMSIPGLFNTVDSTSITTVAGTMEYALPSTIGTVRSVSIAGIELISTTKETIQNDSIRGDLNSADFSLVWSDMINTPYQYYISQTSSGMVLGLFPKAQHTGDAVTIEGEYLLSNLTDSTSGYPLNNLNALRKAQKILIYKVAEVCAAEDGNFNYAQYLHQTAEKMIEELRTYWFVLPQSNNESTIKFQQIEGPTTGYYQHTIRTN
jgi:hypothetical protein